MPRMLSVDDKETPLQPTLPELLHAIRHKQASNPSTWEVPHRGYLDFVTQALLPTYLRNYVGQSNKPKLRIPQHIRETLAGSRRSLHYYIINNDGECSRHTKFIRLWTIPFPPRTDTIITLVLDNFLEMVICRAFQSLPVSSLEEIFGPCPEGQYFEIGLDVISPLLQGRFLSPFSRHKVVQLLSDSPDHEIREWALHRNSENHQLRRTLNSGELPAISTSSSLEEAPLIQASEHIWGPLQVHIIDPQSWFRSTIAKLQQNDSTIGAGVDMISPIGSSEASIGIAFEPTPLHNYDKSGQAISIPWGLREGGFRASNSLIWPFDLQRYTYMSESYQVQSFSTSKRNILRDASQQLIAGTRLRVIIMCGDIEEIIHPTNAKKVVLTLNDMAYNTWVEIQQKKVARIFIRAPAPLSELWSSHGRQGPRRGKQHTKLRKRRLEDLDSRAHKRARGPDEEGLESKD
ncbi:hypothetical protein BDV27DRAFT_155154 [Aspergillus caelatus]|uniref:Uncharacterized protein n=1 Tax=Aspergillus caelatus TaxID=61420 RepID=A0A5N7ADE1_9EURO|nr:uncharacterized protein BDV27DRAFT_155154 [Aspergillus caelatus]KAE8367186.1 hypothetical protein BDV27DRAFT_155154 [Aspergillus caelatus]